jgi:adenine-specific DNA-methyltransferase
VFRGIQHQQIWTALQLIHDVALSPYQTALPLQMAQGSRSVVFYLPKVSAAMLDELESEIHGSGQAVVYSWQPALLAQRFTDPRVSFEAIPAFLVNRFGARSTAKGGRP